LSASVLGEDRSQDQQDWIRPPSQWICRGSLQIMEQILRLSHAFPEGGLNHFWCRPWYLDRSFRGCEHVFGPQPPLMDTHDGPFAGQAVPINSTWSRVPLPWTLKCHPLASTLHRLGNRCDQYVMKTIGLIQIKTSKPRCVLFRQTYPKNIIDRFHVSVL
jgi:hypothetical protein